MSTPIEKNTIDLQAILDTVNALPEAGGGDPVLQEKTVSSATIDYTVTPDSGYDGLSKVTVRAMPTVTQATPSISVSSAGLITASATQSSGYVASGTKSATKHLTVQAAKTITPSTSSQTAVAKGVYTTGAVTVAAIPSTYVKPTTKKAATTYTPGTSNQTIAAGTYCSGAQTIKGDSNLVAANIKKGVSIFGVTGTHEGGEDLDAVISEQATLITSLQTALENKASGGSGRSVETCSLTISFSVYGDPSNVYITYTQYQDDTIESFALITGGEDGVTFSSPYTISNIVKNSVVTIIGKGAFMLGSATCSGCEVLYRLGSIDTIAIKVIGEDATIEIVNNY